MLVVILVDFFQGCHLRTTAATLLTRLVQLQVLLLTRFLSLVAAIFRSCVVLVAMFLLVVLLLFVLGHGLRYARHVNIIVFTAVLRLFR